MDTESKECDKGLVKCTVTYVELSKDEQDEEKIQLLEDRSRGKLIYYLSPYFFGPYLIFNTLAALMGVTFAFNAQIFFIMTHRCYYNIEPKNPELPSPLWSIINFLLYFAMVFECYIYTRRNVRINKKGLQKLLEEIAKVDLMGGFGSLAESCM